MPQEASIEMLNEWYWITMTCQYPDVKCGRQNLHPQHVDDLFSVLFFGA